VLVELPTYTGALTAFGNFRARLVGVQQDADGMDLADLDEALRRERAAGHRVAFVYVVANFQNPTGVLMALDRRSKLIEWAAARDVLIVEDDPYGALYFEDQTTAAHTRPIKADDRDGRVVYLSSFSKTVVPGLRVAWISAAADIVAKLEIAKQSADLMSGALDQRIVHEIWRSGQLLERLPRLRAAYGAKRIAMEQALQRELPDGVSWQTPKGGFFLWASLPARIDTDSLLARAISHGVLYVPGSAFFVDARHDNHLRLSFSAPTCERIDLGIRRLAAAVRDELNARASGAPASDSEAVQAGRSQAR